MTRVFLTLALVAAVSAKVPYIKTREEMELLDQIQIPSASRASSNAARFPLANIQENSGLFQGDILLTDEQKENLVHRSAFGSRNGVVSSDRRWSNRTVVYDIDESFFEKRHIAAIKAGIEELKSVSCVNFRRRNKNDTSYALVTGYQNGCYAHVGFYNGLEVHIVNFGLAEPPFGCFHHGVILHEFLHTLGFWHMQSTHDRDDWVDIIWENIPEGNQHNFNHYDNITVSNYGTDYDYGSIMHYTLYAFSINGNRTIEPKKEYDGLIGQLNKLSESDILKLNRLYQCPGYENW